MRQNKAAEKSAGTANKERVKMEKEHAKPP